jgi:pimeloyl-ACP methyl ester carboxylesterase
MPEFNTGDVQANGLRFHYLETGEGPLALCLHGFPDSPYSYRYLLPELAEAGYRAVAPFNRGFAPTELPAERHHVHSSTMVADALALHEALGADGDAVLIAHDWGAVAAWGAVGQEPERWRRGAILNIPPFPVFGANLFSYDQIKRSFYFWFFQMQVVAEDVISADNFAFIDRIWGDWSPGYDATEDLPRVKECMRDPAHFHTHRPRSGVGLGPCELPRTPLPRTRVNMGKRTGDGPLDKPRQHPPNPVQHQRARA